jgi:hypothetical protein
MAIGKVHVGDVNSDFILTINETVNGVNQAFDLQAASYSTLQIIISDPDGTETIQSGALVNSPGTDGKIHALNTDAALFGVGGAWTAKGRVTLTDGSIFTSNEITFEVLE